MEEAMSGQNKIKLLLVDDEPDFFTDGRRATGAKWP